MADLETIKLVIQSLLISTTRRMSYQDLYKEFRSNEGYDCPYAAMGYRNFLTFLQSIPDTVTVYSNGDVGAVAAPEMKHIAELVALQKRPKPRARRVFGSQKYGSSYKSSYASSSYGAGRSSSYGSSSYGAGRSSSYGSGRSTSYATGRSYSNASGNSTPFSSRPPLHPSPTPSTSCNYQPPSRLSPPISTSYSSEPPPRRSPPSSSSYSYPLPSRPLPRSTSHSSQPPPCLSPPTSFSRPSYSSKNNDMDKFFQKVRETKEQARRQEISNVASSNTHEAASLEEPQPRRPILVPERVSSDESDDSFYDRFKEEEKPNYQRTRPETNSNPLFEALIEPCTNINETLKNNIKNLLKFHPDGLWACLLPEKFQEKYGVSLNWSELGYDSVVQLAHDLSDIMVCKRIKSGDWRLFSASLPLPSEYCEELNTEQVVPDFVKNKLYNIVKNYPSGIRAIQAVQLYHENYGRALTSEAPGFADAESLFISLQDTVIRLRYIRRECYVYPAQQPQELPVLELDTEAKKELGLYPEEVMGPQEKYPPPELPKNIKVGDYIELRVAEVYNPHKFWIMMGGFALKLDNMMDELQDFYHNHGDKYVMPDATISVGQCCTAMYEGEWHRAQIIAVGDLVEVIYVDYGTTMKLQRTELRFIHRDFCTLPSQAIRASMCSIQPAQGKIFTKEANVALLNLVANKALIGLVQNLKVEEPFLDLFLVDTTGDVDIHINDVLVNQNFATFRQDLLEATFDSNDEPADDEPADDEPANDESELCSTFKRAAGSSTAPNASSEIKSDTFSSFTTNNSNSSTVVSSVASNTSCLTGLSTKVSSSMQPQVLSGASSSAVPPPGFTCQPQLGSLAPGLPGMGVYPTAFSTGFNPLVNPGLAAYSAQVGAALLMQQQQQQQQQQAMLLAYYQALYQQSAAASLLSAQAAQAKAAASVPGAVSGSPWLGTPIVQKPQGTSTTQNPSTQSSNIAEPKETSPGKTVTAVSSTVRDSCSMESVETSVKSNQSDSTDDNANKKKKVIKKKRNDKRSASQSKEIPKTDLQSHTGNLDNMLSVSHMKSQTISPRLKTSIQSGNLLKNSFEISEDSYSSCDDIVVDHLQDLMEDPDSCLPSSSSSSCKNIAPDLVQSVANFSISESKSQRSSASTNFWKTVDIAGHVVHLISIEKKAFLSTGEIARSFTRFSTCDTLLRVLTNLDISAPFKKLSRSDCLPLFSALDECSDDILRSFDLLRNKKGNVIGSFHLTPLSNVPSLLIPLDTNNNIIKAFQGLRDSFNG